MWRRRVNSPPCQLISVAVGSLEWKEYRRDEHDIYVKDQGYQNTWDLTKGPMGLRSYGWKVHNKLQGETAITRSISEYEKSLWRVTGVTFVEDVKGAFISKTDQK